MISASTDLLICDVGPRDGLQNEARVLESGERADLARRLARAGIRRVEAGSFVHPGKVPAMVGAEEVFAALEADPDPGADAEWSALVVNRKGLERALRVGVSRIDYAVSVTEEFSRRNTGRSRAEVLDDLGVMVELAEAGGAAVTVTLAVAFGCPFEGRVPLDEVLHVAAVVTDSGADEIVLADTIGVAVPRSVSAAAAAVRAHGPRVGVHLHDTRHTGIANALAAAHDGVTLIDASIGGSGGCPFAPGATGNIATEDLVYALEESGFRTGVDLDAVTQCAGWLSERLGHPLPGAIGRAGGFPIAGVAGATR